MLTTKCLHPEKRYALAAWIVLGALLGIVLLTFKHYGISWDEELQSQYGQAIFDYYASGFVDHRYNQIFNLYYYGGLFDGMAAFFDAYSPLTIYQTRHLFNAIMGLVGLWGTWRLGRLLGGGRTGLLALVLLAVTPMYYGHMFNNPKDIPFAAGIVWSLYYMAKTIRVFPRLPWRLIFKLGLVYGLTLGVRVGGVMLLGYWGLCLLIQAYSLWRWPTSDLVALQPRARAMKLFWGLVKVGIPAGLCSYAVMLLCWPWAQENPLWNPIEALIQFSNFPQDVEVLLDGTIYRSTELPWSYLPVYFGVQLPVLQLFLLGLSIVLLPYLLRTMTPRSKRRAVLLIALMALVPMLYVVLRRPALYDCVRHFLFVLPLINVLGALALDVAISKGAALWGLGGAWRRGGVALGVMALIVGFAAPVVGMIRLHPYEYIYINQLEGGVAGAFGQYELDYWGSSFKEAAEKLQDYVAKEGGVPPGKMYRIAICGPWAAAMIYLPPDYDAVVANEPADFFLSTTRWMCQTMRPGKEIIRIERQGVPLSIIKDLRGDPEISGKWPPQITPDKAEADQTPAAERQGSAKPKRSHKHH